MCDCVHGLFMCDHVFLSVDAYACEYTTSCLVCGDQLQWLMSFVGLVSCMDDICNDVFDNLLTSQNKMAVLVWGLRIRRYQRRLDAFT